ncbi:hypothetical protein [Serratia fonticola]|uniref:hypothetical protein n=1 Tax=Serratia fonticola TaxID=47917 RepID=UPI002DBBC22B|nr:hypothetical protein [Serratia fonticola]MEB7884041.1 hypothetical protein [Serratia fonticola]
MGFFIIDAGLFGKPGYVPASPKEQQLSYYQKSVFFAPIIRVSETGWDEAKFTYLPEDRSEGIPQMVHVFIGLM